MSDFPKSRRILKPGDFERFRKEGFSVTTRAFRIRWRKGDKKRLGLVVSGKVGKAVTRNCLKRIVRECFRCHLPLFPYGDILVIAHPVAGMLKKEEIWKELFSLLKQIQE